MARIEELINALNNEVHRIADQRVAEEARREELSSLLLDAIHKTLKEIKMGASSSDFQELTVVNFIIMAADSFTTEEIRGFVEELRPSREDELG